MTQNDSAILVRELIAQGALRDAAAIAEKRLADGDDAETWQLLAYCLQQLEDFSGAHAAATKAEELGVRDWSNDLVLAASLHGLGRFRDALAPARKALALAPARPDAAIMLLEAILETDGIAAMQSYFASAPQAARETLIEATPAALTACVRRLGASGRFEAAERLCMQAIAQQESGELYETLGRLRQQAGRLEEARGAFVRAIELGAEHWNSHAALEASMGRPHADLTASAARRAFEERPGLSAAADLLGVLARSGGVAAAAAELRRSEPAAAPMLLKAWPITLSAHVRDILEGGDLPGAAAACEAALSVRKGGLLLLLLGEVQSRQGSLHAAAQTYARAADCGAEDPNLAVRLGTDALALGETDLAGQAFRTALRVDPCRLDAALPLLELVLETEGYDPAAKLRESLGAAIKDSALELAWRQMVDEHLPRPVSDLLAKGRVDEAEAEARAAFERLRNRKTYLTLRNIQSYRDWLAFAEPPERERPRVPTISIMLITYNHSKFVAQALDSILMQKTNYRIEIVAVDDASTDDTQAIVRAYQESHPSIISTYFNSVNIGTLSPPQQKVTRSAFRHLKGDYIAVLEGDDYWSSPDKIQRQIEFLERNPNFAICAHNTVKIYEDGKVEPHRFMHWARRQSEFSVDESTEMQAFFHMSSTVFRNYFRGIPPREFASKWSCDMYWLMAHMHHGLLKHLDEDMSIYRAHAGGAWSSLSELQSRIFHLEAMLRYNRWLGYRYGKQFAFVLNRIMLEVLNADAAGTLQGLSPRSRRRYRFLSGLAGRFYDFIDRHPKLDPAVAWYGEPPKPPRPRARRLAGFGLL